MTPSLPNSETSTLVVKAETPMLTMLLPISMEPMKRSRMASSRLTTRARSSPLFSRVSMRAREAPVKAVSPAEKKAERTRQNTTIGIAARG